MTLYGRLRTLGLRQRNGGFTLPGATEHYPPDLALEPVHMALDLFVDLDGEAAHGTVTHRVRSRSAPRRTIDLDGVDLTIEGVSDADGRPVTWQYNGTRLQATWRDPFTTGEERDLVIRYRVERPTTGLMFSKPSAEYPGAGRYAATDHETERARHWLPCLDHPNVRPTLEMRLRAEASLTILANGELVDEQVHDDGTKTAHWRLDSPCPSYLTCFAIGDFTRCEDGAFEGRPIAYFAPSRFTEDQLRRSFGRTGEMLAWLQDKVGTEFPYPKYYQFAVPGIGGAMENISLVSWDSRFLLDEMLATEWTWLLDQINIHEMAHAYFGDWIVCRDYSHAWLKESWATYIETCWLEDKRSTDEADYNVYVDAFNYFGEADNAYKRPIVTRVFDHSWHLYDYHLYPGGACRLHMLRKTLGDDVFWAGVRRYVRTFGGQVVETADFRRILEDESGRSLARFFDQWFYKKGYPHLEVRFSHDPERAEGRFDIEQKQVDDKAGVATFYLELVLAWTIEGRDYRRTVVIEDPKHVVVASMAAPPESLRIDPDGDQLLKLAFNPGDDMLRRQLTGAKDVVGRILAAHELAKTGRDRNVQAVEEAYDSEPFWGCRVQFAKALAEAGTGRAVAALARLVATEKHPMVLESLLRAAGPLRDGTIREVLERRLDGELPYRARGAALEGLGRQRDAAPTERLEAALRERTFGGFVETGAAVGLAESRQAAAIDPLLEQTRPGVGSRDARHFMVGAVGQLGRTLEKRDRERVVEALVDLLRDNSEPVRQRAVLALQTMRATEATGALRSYARRVSDQDRSDVERVLAELRKTAQGKGDGVSKQMESLEDRLRKLEETLRKLEAQDEAGGQPKKIASKPKKADGKPKRTESKPKKKPKRKSGS